MPRLTQTTVYYGLAGVFGGAAAWAPVLSLSARSNGGLSMEVLLGALVGLFVGSFVWSHETITARRPAETAKRILFGGAAGAIGGAAGSLLGNTVFSTLGRHAAGAGGFRASAGVAAALALGWAVLGASVGASGGVMIRSRERAVYGLAGGAVGGAVGGLLFTFLSSSSPWSVLAGLSLLGLSIGGFISIVEEVFVSARVKVIKGRHLGREFPLLKDRSLIGRDDRADVCLSGAEGVSLRHAAIRRAKGRYRIEIDDRGKPVYVNQKMTSSGALADGDVIRVGSILLLFSAVRKAAMIAALVLPLAVLAAPRPAEAGPPASVQITQFDLGEFPVVKAYVSVLDADGRPVAGIERNNLALSENGRPVAIDGLRMVGTAGSREPLSIAIVVDRSESMTGEKIEQAKLSVERFLSLMEPGDRASVIAFSDAVMRLEALTDNTDLLKHSLAAIQPGGHTALFDAIVDGVASVHGASGRKAVIVLTDGIANRGSFDQDRAIETAVRDNTSVYVIGLGKDVRTARLERISGETGGTYFFTPAPEGLRKIYETISTRIRNEYVLTFGTEQRAAYLRTVSLSLGHGLATTRSYFQPRSSLFGSGALPPSWAFAVPFLCIAGFAAVSLRKIDRQYRTGHLSLVRGAGKTKDIDIGKTVLLGTDERGTLDLSRAAGTGRQHAEVIEENGRYVIEGRGSGTAAFVNKQPVTGRQVLQDGDVIDVGNATIVFSDPTVKACGNCGESLRPGAKFCPKCGSQTG